MAGPIHVNMSSLLHVVEVIGVFVFASSGLVEARRKKMDLVGVFTVAFITAVWRWYGARHPLGSTSFILDENYEYPNFGICFFIVVSPFFRQLRQVVTESNCLCGCLGARFIQCWRCVLPLK